MLAGASKVRQEEYVDALRRLEERGVNLKTFYPENMKATLGNSGTSAVVYYLGESSFNDPTVLVGRLFQLFGIGAFSLLDGMIARAATQAPIPSQSSRIPLR